MKGKSCLANLVAFYNKITASVGERRAVDVAYLNFIKAFDTVFCDNLIDTLLNGQKYGQ